MYLNTAISVSDKAVFVFYVRGRILIFMAFPVDNLFAITSIPLYF